MFEPGLEYIAGLVCYCLLWFVIQPTKQPQRLQEAFESQQTLVETTNDNIIHGLLYDVDYTRILDDLDYTRIPQGFFTMRSSQGFFTMWITQGFHKDSLRCGAHTDSLGCGLHKDSVPWAPQKNYSFCWLVDVCICLKSVQCINHPQNKPSCLQKEAKLSKLSTTTVQHIESFQYTMYSVHACTPTKRPCKTCGLKRPCSTSNVHIVEVTLKIK